MAYEDWSGGISEHEAGEEFMEKEDERRRDERQSIAAAFLRMTFDRIGAIAVCCHVADYYSRPVTASDDMRQVWAALEELGLPEVLSLVGKWAQEQQKSKGSAA